jgi:hypothetical protein
MYDIAGMPKKSPRKPTSIREPVQVYLGQDDRDLLNRLVAETGLTKAEILRQGMRSFAREQGGASPMLRFIAESAQGEWPEGVAAKHDEILAESYRGTTRKRR